MIARNVVRFRCLSCCQISYATFPKGGVASGANLSCLYCGRPEMFNGEPLTLYEKEDPSSKIHQEVLLDSCLKRLTELDKSISNSLAEPFPPEGSISLEEIKEELVFISKELEVLKTL